MRPGLAQVLIGDALDALRTLPAESVHCCVTSPPYWGLRDYGVDGQIGLEPTPEAFVARLVEVFREVRRVLRADGTLWLNLGDSYAATTKGCGGLSSTTIGSGKGQATNAGSLHASRKWHIPPGLKPKDLVGIPWRVAFALQADGWWLRQDIIWHKPNPMPESVRDRCTKAHEYLFLLAKSKRYYFDSEAMQERAATGYNLGRASKQPRFGGVKYGDSEDPKHATKSGNEYEPNGVRNRRSVWTVAPQPYTEAHFATFPPKLIEPCILAGCPVGGTVLDPFAGAGTTLAVAVKQGRNALGIELNPEYARLIDSRLAEADDGHALYAEATP